ncbi:serine/threonine protein phosphatase 1 [Selenomonas sp. GACV-9]|uniref:metallophosphoesterase family protein n=1 Tax=Selenomonas sp. GACV-9 TaxID=3158782 RepID=UPI0008F0D317|nr:serine/threonine protein phosphatase 1 [Selenomonas ruminantium]
MYERILAVGDIHGEWDKFLSLYRQLDFNPEKDLLVFLGDYIDRGARSMDALIWMYEHRQEKAIIMLRGNHEQMMLDYYDTNGQDDIWLQNGGDITADALASLDGGTQRLYLDFVRSLPLAHHLRANNRDYFFCHAGVDPAVPLDEQAPETLLWIRERFFDHYTGETIVVAGHTNTAYIEPLTPLPIIRRNMILVDTGSYMHYGHISCVDVLSGRIWQDC